MEEVAWILDIQLCHYDKGSCKVVGGGRESQTLGDLSDLHVYIAFWVILSIVFFNFFDTFPYCPYDQLDEHLTCCYLHIKWVCMHVRWGEKHGTQTNKGILGKRYVLGQGTGDI